MTTCLLVWKLAQWRLGSSMTLLKMTELMHIQEGRRVGNFLEPGCEAADRQECFSCGFPFFFFFWCGVGASEHWSHLVRFLSTHLEATNVKHTAVFTPILKVRSMFVFRLRFLFLVSTGGLRVCVARV